MAEGPRTSWGAPVVAPNGWTVTGYPYDGGWMDPAGIPARNIGTATRPPGNLALGTAQLTLFWMNPPDATADPTNFNWDTDVARVVKESPAVQDQFDLSGFRNQGGKMIFYHGLSDSGPPWTYTAYYYDNITKRGQGRNPKLDDFARLYMVPNMGHCSGGPSTDRFDFLAPLMAWVEQGKAPDTVLATGVNFKSAPTTRSRPLCPYPQTVRYIGSGDIADAASYRCQ
jgi:feruloyl esterase